MLAALFHLLFAEETAAQEVLTLLAVGGSFVLVIALGELSHWLRHRR